ncbi:MAG: hypothetical protein HY758_02880 [Nitrospirae bacterium]|nr:hypothetical protein [Nitrospirota bacterium]
MVKIDINKFLIFQSSILSVIILFAFFHLPGCTPRVPSENDAKKVFENRWSLQISHGMMEIISFRKVKERKDERIGIKFHIIEFEAELKVKDFSPEDWQQLRLEGHFEKEKGPDEGETVRLWSEVSFAGTGKGWKGEDGEVY